MLFGIFVYGKKIVRSEGYEKSPALCRAETDGSDRTRNGKRADTGADDKSACDGVLCKCCSGNGDLSGNSYEAARRGIVGIVGGSP